VDLDATIVRSEALRGYLASKREELRKYYLTVYMAHQPLAVGSQSEFGLKHGPFSLGLNARTPDLMQQVISAVAASLPDYELYTPELFFGVGQPVRPHNDVSLFLRAGQEVPIQLWILLESCIISPAGVTETGSRNALEVCVPVAAGPVYAGTSYVLTPEGRQELSIGQTIGGDSLENGDLLLFKNGCVHFTRPVKQPGLFRAALAVRAIRRDRQEDSNYLRWMKQLWATDELLRSEARGTYISSARRMLLDNVDDQAPDMTRLSKRDANDYGALVAALQQIDPVNAAPAVPGYIDLRTAQSLVD
jgi:hypothetical protein